MAVEAARLGEQRRALDGDLVVGEALLLGPLRHERDRLGAERLLRGRALPGEHAHRDDDEDRGDERDRAAQDRALGPAVEERQPDQEHEQQRRHADRAEHDRLGPLEDAEEIEEEVEEPVGARHEVRRARIGLVGVERPERADLAPTSSPWFVYFQITASAMITATTTSDMIVSWRIA